MYEPLFSDSSYGFRPKRSAHQAISKALEYYEQGYRYVVDLDLAKYFDTVNHAILIGVLRERIKDERVVKLIHKFLKSGVLEHGLVSPTREGTPQGGNLSPLLSNIYLTAFDQLLESRGHKFVRYADDCNIYVKSRRAAERVMSNCVKFLEGTLKLTVNQTKSQVGSPLRLKFLGFSLYKTGRKAGIRPHQKSIKRFKEFIMSLCEQFVPLGAKEKSIIDRCTANVYRGYQQRNYTGKVPTLKDFREELLRQEEPEAQSIALAIELFTDGSLNTFAKQTNVDTDNRLICYDILDLGKQLMSIGMLVVMDSILNRITQNRAKGKATFIFIDEIYLLFQHEYSANFLFTLWKRVRKYGAFATGITQNVDDLLQSHTARTMLANSEFIVMLNQASTDREELARLLNISDLQLSYITNVDAGHGLIRVGSSLVPFANKFPKNTKLYKLMTTKPGEGTAA